MRSHRPLYLCTNQLDAYSWPLAQTSGLPCFSAWILRTSFSPSPKLLNYLGLQRTSECTFAVLLVVWAYFRIWQNLRMLRSVWFDYDTLTPPAHRVFNLFSGPLGLAPWIKPIIFASIALLLALNVFWYALMWKIVLR